MGNVPKIQFTATGPVLPAESDILIGVQADMNAAFGGNLNMSLETPQGQMATSTTAVIADKNSEIAYMVNQVDPAYSSGRWQDGIGRIYMIDRIPGTGTVVTVTCTGSVGVIIPSGTKAKDTSGNIYTNDYDVVIGSGGNVTAQFTCTVFGPTACPSGSLAFIYQSINGWDSITNPTDGIPGRLVESRNDFEFRRKNSVALNAQGTPDAVLASVLGVKNVTDCYVYNNGTGAEQLIGITEYPVPAHCLYVGVAGGNSVEIASAIFAKLSSGCDLVGNVTETIEDMNYNVPRPAYDISFNVPTDKAIKFAVQITASQYLPSDSTQKIKDAIIAAFTGEDGGFRARIGSQITAGRYYAGVAGISPYCDVISLLLGTTSPTLNSIEMGIDENPTLTQSDITVTYV